MPAKASISLPAMAFSLCVPNVDSAKPAERNADNQLALIAMVTEQHMIADWLAMATAYVRSGAIGIPAVYSDGSGVSWRTRSTATHDRPLSAKQRPQYATEHE